MGWQYGSGEKVPAAMPDDLDLILGPHVVEKETLLLQIPWLEQETRRQASPTEYTLWKKESQT